MSYFQQTHEDDQDSQPHQLFEPAAPESSKEGECDESMQDGSVHDQWRKEDSAGGAGGRIMKFRRRLFDEVQASPGGVPFSIANQERSPYGGTCPMDISQFGSAIEDHHSNMQVGYDELYNSELPMNKTHEHIAMKPPMCPLTPNQQSQFGNLPRFNFECPPNHLTYSPVPQATLPSLHLVSLPEYGFSSKILSAQKMKKKKFVPTTPAKRNVKNTHKYSQGAPQANRFGIVHDEGRFATQVKVTTTTVGSGGYHDSYDIYSPIAYLLKFYEELEPATGTWIMKVDSIPTKPARFETEFEILGKLGEGSFGEAYKARHRFDNRLYAVKKSKEQYLGYKDREQKLLEVYKQLKITQQVPKSSKGGGAAIWTQSDQSEDFSEMYRSHCVRFYEAWEEKGHLYIQSELCEKGNLNDYLNEMNQTYRKAHGMLDEDEAILWRDIVKDDQIWKFLFEMTCALKQIHDQGFVHLDVKPSNFFVRECGSLALGDFGQAVEISKIPKLRDDDVEGDSVFMAPELLQTIIPPVKRITTKADIFSLGASLLEITLGINLPQNGVMWQKLRQAGEGQIEFSPNSKRQNGEVEQLITLLMEPDPKNRPSSDEILLHPNLQKFFLQYKDQSQPSTTAHKEALPSGRNLISTKLSYSPIVQKFTKPFTSSKSDYGGANLDYSSQLTKSDKILISPSLLFKAQNDEYVKRHPLRRTPVVGSRYPPPSIPQNQLHKRLHHHDDDGNRGSPQVTCRKKRRRKSEIGSCSEDSVKREPVREKSRSFDFEDDPEVDEDGMPVSLRTVGRAPSFKEDQVVQMNQPYPSRLNFGMNVKPQQENHIPKSCLTSKQMQENLVEAADNWHPFKKDKYKSAKKLQFGDDEPPSTPFNIGEDDLQSNNFSPNDEGPTAPLLIFEHHGIQKKLNVDSVDEDMEEEENEETPLFQHESNSSNPAQKSHYFGDFSLQAPATKLQKNLGSCTLSHQSSLGAVSNATFGSVSHFQNQNAAKLFQDTINNMQIPQTLRMGSQFSFSENINYQNMNSTGKLGNKVEGGSKQKDNHSSGASGMSTPKLFRLPSNTSGTGGVPAAINSQTGSVLTSNTGGGFQLRSSNVSVFELNRNSNVTFYEPRSSNPPHFLDQQRSSNGQQGVQDLNLQARHSNTSNQEIAAEHSRFSNINKASQFTQPRTFPKAMNWLTNTNINQNDTHLPFNNTDACQHNIQHESKVFGSNSLDDVMCPETDLPHQRNIDTKQQIPLKSGFLVHPGPTNNTEGMSKIMQRLAQQEVGINSLSGSNISEGSTGGAPFNDVKRNLFQI